jgi:hypothetical protein
VRKLDVGFVALIIAGVTLLLIVLGALFPDPAALALSGTRPSRVRASSSYQAATENLMQAIGRKDWEAAYSNLANRSEFSEADFVRDLTGGYFSLRTYASLDTFDLKPQHATNDEADVKAELHWSTVVGTFQETRNLHVLRTEDRWQVVWPIVKEHRVPPQVIPVNYLRWDVIYRGPEDDWGAQDVESPHVRIVDMSPVDREGGVAVLGEILNEDVVPAFVTVKATLVAKNGSDIATEDAFDKMSHILLPKQVSPFRIDFRGVHLLAVDSIRMAPSSSLVAASADPVIEIEDQKLTPAPGPSLTGQLVNQSGQVVNITHVLGTFYDNRGQIVWVGDEFVNRALLPKIPAQFAVSIPADLAGKVSHYRAITATYSANRFQ